MLKYDHKKLANILLAEYREKYGSGNPSSSINKLIECMDDAFVDEWAKQVSKIGDVVSANAASTLELADQALAALRKEVEKNQQASEEARKTQEVTDKRVMDALKAYQTIVNMEFDTPQQKLQNIQNASYFIWALYSEGEEKSTFPRAVTNVKEESEYPPPHKAGRKIGG